MLVLAEFDKLGADADEAQGSIKGLDFRFTLAASGDVISGDVLGQSGR